MSLVIIQHNMVVQSTQSKMLYLPSMEPTTLSTTQQNLVVQLTLRGMLCLPSMELTTLSTTQQTMVVQSMQKSTYHWVSLHGTNNFTHNSVGIKGGTVFTSDNSVLTFIGTNNFINNSAESGGAIDTGQWCSYLQWNQQLYQQLSKQWQCNLCSNQRYLGGQLNWREEMDYTTTPVSAKSLALPVHIHTIIVLYTYTIMHAQHMHPPPHTHWY